MKSRIESPAQFRANFCWTELGVEKLPTTSPDFLTFSGSTPIGFIGILSKYPPYKSIVFGILKFFWQSHLFLQGQPAFLRAGHFLVPSTWWVGPSDSYDSFTSRKNLRRPTLSIRSARFCCSNLFVSLVWHSFSNGWTAWGWRLKQRPQCQLPLENKALVRPG